MAKKPSTEPKRYEEGFIRGKRALLVGIFPVFLFLGLMVGGAWLLVDYYNKTTVNEDNNDVCKLVRKYYSSSVRADYPCGVTEDGGDWIVSFNQNPGTASAPVYMSFRVNKDTQEIRSALNVE